MLEEGDLEDSSHSLDLEIKPTFKMNIPFIGPYLGYIVFRPRFFYVVQGRYRNSRERKGNTSHSSFLEQIWNGFDT